LGESSSALMVDGSVVATVDTSISRISYIYVPIKLSTGQYLVDLTPGKSIVGYWSPQRGISIANTYLMAVLTPVDAPDTLAQIISVIANYGDKTFNITKDSNKGQLQLVKSDYSIDSSTKYNLTFDAPFPKIQGTKGQVLKYDIMYIVEIRKYNATKENNNKVKIEKLLEAKTFVLEASQHANIINTLQSFNGIGLINATPIDNQHQNYYYYYEIEIKQKGPYRIVIGLPDDVDSNGLTFKEFFAKFAGGKVVTVMDWVAKVNDDTVLDPGEKILMLTYYNDNTAMPQSYDTIKLEVRVPIGAPLTIERNVPPSLTQGVVDLG